MKIVSYIPEYRNDIIDLSLRAWTPVFAAMEAAVDAEIFDLWYQGDWRSAQTAAVAATLADEGAETWVALEDGRPVGFTALRFHADEKMGEVYMIAVDPAHQRKGIASALIDASVARMEAAGMKLAMIETGTDSGHGPARKAYEKAGFTLIPVARYFRKL